MGAFEEETITKGTVFNEIGFEYKTRIEEGDRTFYRSNPNDFYEYTKADFIRIPSRPYGEPDYTSPSGSEYWYYEDGVVRGSNHWGTTASCKWKIDAEPYRGPEKLYGFNGWNEFILLSVKKDAFLLAGHKITHECLNKNVVSEDDIQEAIDNAAIQYLNEHYSQNEKPWWYDSAVTFAANEVHRIMKLRK